MTFTQGWYFNKNFATLLYMLIHKLKRFETAAAASQQRERETEGGRERERVRNT